MGYNDLVKCNPTALEGYLAGKLAIDAIDDITIGGITSGSILDAVYRSTIFNLLGQTVGPYLDNFCYASDPASATCECNQGMHSVWMTRYNSSSIPFVYAMSDATNDVFHFGTCGVVFQPYIHPALASSVNVLAIVLPCLVVLLLATALVCYKLTANYRQLKKLYSNEV